MTVLAIFLMMLVIVMVFVIWLAVTWPLLQWTQAWLERKRDAAIAEINKPAERDS